MIEGGGEKGCEHTGVAIEVIKQFAKFLCSQNIVAQHARTFLNSASASISSCSLSKRRRSSTGGLLLCGMVRRIRWTGMDWVDRRRSKVENLDRNQNRPAMHKTGNETS